MQVKGLPIGDFTDFVTTAAGSVNAPLPVGAAKMAAIKRLHEASNGSPLFASAILRLVAMGEPLGKAINQYKGADGEQLRRFAFEKELGNLTDSQLRLVFAAVHLRDCTIDELVEATHSNRALVRDDVAALRNYHLMSLGSPKSGYSGDEPIVSIPSEIAAMADIIFPSVRAGNRKVSAALTTSLGRPRHAYEVFPHEERSTTIRTSKDKQQDWSVGQPQCHAEQRACFPKAIE